MKIKNRSKRRVPRDFREEYRPLHGDYRSAALKLFRRFLMSEDPDDCDEICFLMRQLGSKSLVRPLIDAALHLPARKQELAVYVLADFFDTRSTPFFRKMWRDTTRFSGIRCVSLEALGWNLCGKHRRLRQELELAVRDEDSDVVMSAACILTFARHHEFVGIRDRLLLHSGCSSGGRSIAEFVRTKVLPWWTT
jgi:hypothetical protein